MNPPSSRLAIRAQVRAADGPVWRYTFLPMDWARRYADQSTPWDLRRITPPLAALLESGRLDALGHGAGGHVAVPGCGRGHDLRAFAGAGYRVTGFDIVPSVVAEARALLELNRTNVDEVRAEVHCRDILGIGAEFAARFDVVYDYTCFCALPPHLRTAYGREVGALLRSGGIWLGLAFPLDPARTGQDGPPHLILPEHLEASFGPAGLQAEVDFPAEGSVLARAGAERWFVRRRV